MLERLNSPEVACDSVGLPGLTFEDGGKMPSVPLSDEQHQRTIEIQNSLCFIESDISSLESETTFFAWTEGGMRPTQLAAASRSCITTSATGGRDSISLTQQRWTKPHSKSENPMDDAFSGLTGRLPSTTAHPNSACRTPRNGISPVRTWVKYV